MDIQDEIQCNQNVKLVKRALPYIISVNELFSIENII